VSVLGAIRSQLRSVFLPGPRPPAAGAAGAWMPIVREPYTGAWQNNQELRLETALSNPVVFRCVSLIATDVGKLPLRLMAVDGNGIWHETTSPAFSPVLRTPNRYQTPAQFFETWMISKLLWGNTYVLKDRDARGVVTALYVLDPCRVKPLVSPEGAVYYELQVNELAGILSTAGPLVVPARELIHDRWNCAFHPLVGLSPLYACGGAASQGNAIQSASTAFFSKGGQPSGVMMPPDPTIEMDQATIERLSATWKGLGPGGTAFLGRLFKYEPVGSSAVDAELTAQLGMTAKTIAGCFGVPISMVDSSQQPPYANSEASTLQYHSQCLQTHLTAIEVLMDAGLELPAPYGTEFDLDDLIWLDVGTRTKAAHDAIGAGAMTPNEARRKYFGLGPVPGGDTPYLQQQYVSLESLSNRDLGVTAPAPAPVSPSGLAPATPDGEAS
jgi:HK97 family phage portal protein